jgi:protein-tyrosine phosphatase
LPYVETHFHLLPAVDDGPRTIEESVALAAAAVADGTRTVIVTPHVHPAHVVDTSEIPERVRWLADRLHNERIQLSILPGGELEHTMVERLDQRSLDVIAHGPRGWRWLLVEAPFDGLSESFTAATDELRERGFAAVIAHPERVEPSSATRAVLEHEVSCGSVLQLTAGAFLGVYGAPMRDTALELLRWAPQAVIASDAHGLHRMPMLRKAVAALAAAGVPDPGGFAAELPSRLLERGIVAGPDRLAA